MLNPWQKSKNQSNNSLQTAHRNYYYSTHSKQYLVTIIREINPNVSYKLSSDKSLEVILKNYCQRNHWKQYLTFIRESFQTIYIGAYYYQRNHSKQILETTRREIIANSSYKLLSENHSKQYLQTNSTEIIPKNTYILLPEKSLQIMLTKVYQRIQVIPNNTSYL